MFVKSLVLVLAGLCTVPAALAAEAPASIAHKAILSLAAAQQIAAHARKVAADKGWPCAVAIVDDGGWPILTLRMDGAPVVAGIELAQGKARTSALFKRPSGDLENAINNGRPAAITAGLLMMKGAQPIILEGQVVGAIGISADTPAHDDEIALAAVASVQP
ncbi:heme-binding protein [Pseudomonas sp. D6002]|uniref:GlcG/HbpS family heme-binding protein n=1 Tax=Pseudomonas TaxID=286 RepID=UPI000281CE6F|nr:MULTISPECIES: heme-binding protein [Pseudomonas]NVZ96128.1 heme-binding protein [Pseudomonas sp. B6001]NWB13469.1 heme-binding protein [Pseudomonas sp. D6002]QQD55954.1 heme-binding protein [Pseudomonas fluorescens BBc6R8]